MQCNQTKIGMQSNKYWNAIIQLFELNLRNIWMEWYKLWNGMKQMFMEQTTGKAPHQGSPPDSQSWSRLPNKRQSAGESWSEIAINSEHMSHLPLLFQNWLCWSWSRSVRRLETCTCLFKKKTDVVTLGNDFGLALQSVWFFGLVWFGFAWNEIFCLLPTLSEAVLQQEPGKNCNNHIFLPTS